MVTVLPTSMSKSINRILSNRVSLASVEHISLRTNRQKEPWFINTLNPNGRIPVLVDRNRPTTTGAEGFAVFETAAILLYLSQHYDPQHKLWFDAEKQPEDYSEMLQWIFFAVRLYFFVAQTRG